MKKFYKSRKDKIFCGVCGGIGNYFCIDPFFFRLIFLFLTIITGLLPLTIAYFITALIVPVEPRNRILKKYPRLYRSRSNHKIAGICGGMSEAFQIDATIIRLIMFVLMFITGILPVCFSYIVGWMIIPKTPLSSTKFR